MQLPDSAGDRTVEDCTTKHDMDLDLWETVEAARLYDWDVDEAEFKSMEDICRSETYGHDGDVCGVAAESSSTDTTHVVSSQ